jgi:predicted AAA+ superfamily ATPase
VLPPNTSDRLAAIPQRLPVLVYPGPEWQKDEAINGLNDFYPTMHTSTGARIVLLVLALPGPLIQQAEYDLRTFFSARFIDTIKMGLDEIQNLVISDNPQQELLSRLLRIANLELISPYRGEGPAPRAMFFGRVDVLQEITTHIQDTSFCIIGGRKVGKTSILNHLHQDNLPAANFRSIYLSLDKVASDEELWAHPLINWQPDQPANAPETLAELLDRPHGDKKIILLLDEVDKILPYDRANGWRFINHLRGLNNEGQIRVILCGEKSLNRLLKDGGDALYNFTTRIPLKLLNDDEVAELVTRPMRDLQIELQQPEQITQKVFDFSAGHPAVVQYICRRLIILINQDHRRQITPADVDNVTSQVDFQEKEFLNLFWERATELEKIISTVMASSTAPFTLDDVQKAIKDECSLAVSDHEVIEALDSLVELRSILLFEDVHYRYKVEAFQTVLGNVALRNLLLRGFVSIYSSRGSAGDNAADES